MLSREVVEACRLQSSAGIAVVLLNWTDEPISDLTVTVPNVAGFHTVTSVRHGSLKAPILFNKVTSANDAVIHLPLDNVDVLMIE